MKKKFLKKTSIASSQMQSKTARQDNNVLNKINNKETAKGIALNPLFTGLANTANKFKNPNYKISALGGETNNNLKKIQTLLFLGKSNCKPKVMLAKQTANSALPTNLATNNKFSSTIWQILSKIDKPASYWPGLMFLHKKGLSHVKPNFNIISYGGFTGASLDKKGETVIPKYNTNKILLNNVYKLLVYFFKSMYCIISKPVFIFTQDTIKIQLFYFACIGKNITRLLASPKNPRGGVAMVKIMSNSKNLAKIAPNSVYLNNYFSNLTKFHPNKFKYISRILSKFFNKKVEFDLIRLHKPYYNSQILVNFLSLIINRKDTSNSINKIFASKSMNNSFLASTNNFVEDNSQLMNYNSIEGVNCNRLALSKNAYINSTAGKAIKSKDASLWQIRLVDKWLGIKADGANNPSNALIPGSTAYLTGIKININGRLRREPVIPKVTTKLFEKGFTAKGRINYSETARFTNKNRKGAFSITIKSGQNL